MGTCKVKTLPCVKLLIEYIPVCMMLNRARISDSRDGFVQS